MELTKKEAIELLKERYMTMSMCADKDYCAKQNAAIDMAIAALSAQDFTTEGGTVMRDNEIIEALDCCEGYNSVSFCSDCPLLNKGNCTNILSHEAYNLINRQKAEIEQLKVKHEILIKNADTAFQDGLNEAQDLYASQIRNEVKQEVIKEFVERLKERSFEIILFGSIIPISMADQIAKEMSDETENEDAGERIYDDFMKSCKL